MSKNIHGSEWFEGQWFMRRLQNPSGPQDEKQYQTVFQKIQTKLPGESIPGIFY